MSRFFNGGIAADSITFSLGSAPTVEGPITVAVLARAASTGFVGWLVQGFTGTSGAWAALTASSKMFMENDFTSGGPSLTTDWCWYVVTKAAGSAVPRWHVHDLTAATAWAHADGSGSVNSPAATATGIQVGAPASGGAGNSWRGRIAAAAVWGSVLGDLSVEAACTSAAVDLLNAAPAWMIRLNQASTGTSVADDTGHGGNQTALSGTAVDADEPPGWSYSLAVTRTADASLAVTATLASGGTVTGQVGAALAVTASLVAQAAVGKSGGARTPTFTVDVARSVATADLTRPSFTVAL